MLFFQKNSDKPKAAIVSDVHGSDCVCLAYLEPTGHWGNAQHVPVICCGDEKPCEDYCQVEAAPPIPDPTEPILEEEKHEKKHGRKGGY